MTLTNIRKRSKSTNEHQKLKETLTWVTQRLDRQSNELREYLRGVRQRIEQQDLEIKRRTERNKLLLIQGQQVIEELQKGILSQMESIKKNEELVEQIRKANQEETKSSETK